MKRLTIENFGSIRKVDIELRRVNLIIGPLNSGKSVVMKVACFCDWIEEQVEISQDPEKYFNAQYFVSNLIDFYDLDGFMQRNSYVKYETDVISFDYSAKTNKCTYTWSKTSKRWSYKRTKISYIPSERNLVAAIPNWFQVSMNNNVILDFMKEWEFARKNFSKKEKLLDLPFYYRYNPSDNSDRIVMPDGKEIKLTKASSGLQSLTPFYIILRYLTKDFFNEKHTKVEEVILRNNLKEIIAKECPSLSSGNQNAIVDSLLTHSRTDLFIEEPEAHLFPLTQKEFVYTFVSLLNGQKKHSCFIATHSPYIMTAMNNLIMAGEVMAESPEKAAKVGKRFPKRKTLRYKDVAAFAIKDGEISSIMDEDLKLISADAIDDASQEISDDYNFLLEVRES